MKFKQTEKIGIHLGYGGIQYKRGIIYTPDINASIIAFLVHQSISIIEFHMAQRMLHSPKVLAAAASFFAVYFVVGIMLEITKFSEKFLLQGMSKICVVLFYWDGVILLKALNMVKY